jgi:hypothetical protein
MRLFDAFTAVVASAEQTRNAVRILRAVILGAALLLAELCAAVALFGLLPAGVSTGLLAVVPSAGVAACAWAKARRKTG